MEFIITLLIGCMKGVFFVLKYGWILVLAYFIYGLIQKKSGGTKKNEQASFAENGADYDEEYEEDDEEDPWAWKREHDRRRRYEAQREARREERRKSGYDDCGYDEERETHYGEEHDVDESGYCHDCDCEEDDLI